MDTVPDSDRTPVPRSPVHHLDLRLAYADCDPAGILYYAAWFPWMERVQSEWLYLNGFRQDQLQQVWGFRTITRSANCEYLVPATLFEQIRVQLSVEHLGRTSFRWGFDMVRLSDSVPVARAALTLVTIDDDGRPTAVPQPLRSLLTGAVPQPPS
ncbi:acyl-CoA thioesterase [Nakamurella silvestris]|nr:acyl-CoA thioesterase [Nakamurella silvestris]